MKPKNLLQRVLKFARTELEKRARPQDEAPTDTLLDDGGYEPEPFAHAVSEASEGPAREPEVRGLELVRAHDGGALTLRWSVSEDEVARAERLLQGHPVLCLRIVSFAKARDDVLREVQDRPGVDLAGQCEIGEPPQRGVVSVGLRAGDRFVSIAHHVI